MKARELSARDWIIGCLGACLLDAFILRKPESGTEKLALVQVALLAISVGLSLLAGYLLSKKNKSLVQDDRPTNLATRGSYIPRVIGRRRVGFLFGWAGDRTTRKERIQGGKGDVFSQKQTVYVESAWHLLCIGPGKALWEIEQNGEIIFTGPITPLSHPSGTTIDLGKEGSFVIYWGQNGVADGQPVNTNLGNAARVGVSSSWPRIMYIHWIGKRLGTSPIWPQMSYVVEVGLQNIAGSILTGSTQYVPPTKTLDGGSVNINAVQNGAPGTAYVELLGSHIQSIFPGNSLTITGNTGLGVDTLITVRKVLIVGFPIRTRVFTNETLSGATNDGQILTYEYGIDDGYNLAHIIAELLFEPWPYGIQQPRTGSALEFDLPSLEALGALLETEGIVGSVIMADGQDLRTALGAILMDVGCMLAMDPRTGLLKFVPIRKPSGTLPNITHDIQSGRKPEVETVLSGSPSDRVVFAFTDRQNNYRDMTIAIDEDGQAAFAQYYKQRIVQITSVVNFSSAAAIAERRSFEEVAGSNSKIVISANRAARLLIPGTAVLADGFDEVLRVTEVEPGEITSQTEVTLMADVMGARKSDFETDRPNIPDGADPTEEDFAFQPVEMTEYLLNGQPQTVIIVRVRKDGGVLGAYLYISRDDTTYTFIGEDASGMTGGALDVALASSSEMNLDQGPTFTLQGPDAASALDLSADTTSWLNGRQLAILVNAAGAIEICFLKKITAISGSQYRLDGLLRARYETTQIALSSGDRVYVVQNDDGFPIQDVLLEPQVTLYAKAQPFGVGTVPLTSIVSKSLDLYGKGIRPLPVKNIALDTGADSAGSGPTLWSDFFYKLAGSAPDDDLVIRWAYFTPRSTGTGAGMFPAGGLVTDPSPEGSFYVEILDSGDVVKRTATVTDSTYTYTRTDRLSDFSAVEPALFKVRVTQIRDGYQSDALTQTFTKVT